MEQRYSRPTAALSQRPQGSCGGMGQISPCSLVRVDLAFIFLGSEGRGKFTLCESSFGLGFAFLNPNHQNSKDPEVLSLLTAVQLCLARHTRPGLHSASMWPCWESSDIQLPLEDKNGITGPSEGTFAAVRVKARCGLYF